MNEETIFAAALEKNSPAERAAFLDRACSGNPDLRRQIDDLLRAYDDAGSFLQTPALQPQATETMSGEQSQQASSEDIAGPTLVGPASGTCGTDDEMPLDFLEPLDESQPADSTDTGTPLGRLGPYLITEVVGRGGMGVVLKGQDPKLNRVVAIKVLAPELATNATARKRFLREAQAAAAVSHDHVVTIHAIDEAGRLPYIVMEYIAGCSLQQRIDRSGPLEVKRILRIARQTALGLAVAHEQGLIHRDVKPANILLENGVERVKLTDFGLARAVDDVGTTQTGVVAGTPQYMSPEQAQGQYVDHRSDLFSLGCVMYAMCTGRSPFRGDSTVAVLRRVCDVTPRPIVQVNPEIPDWLAAIINKLLAKHPEERFQSTGEVAELLGRCLAHVQQPAQVPLPELIFASGDASDATLEYAPVSGSTDVPKATARRGRWLMTAAAVALMLLISLGVAEATGVTELSQTIIQVVTGQGTLILEVDDPAVSVQIDGEELVIQGAGVHEVRVRPGKRQIQTVKDGKPVHQELVTISRGGKRVVNVRREPALPEDALRGLSLSPDPDRGLKAVAGDLMARLADELPRMTDEEWQEFRDDFLQTLAAQPEILDLFFLDDGELSNAGQQLQARLSESEWDQLLERYLDSSLEQAEAHLVDLTVKDWQQLREQSLFAIRENPSYRETVLSYLKFAKVSLPPDATPEQLADEFVRVVREMKSGKRFVPEVDKIDEARSKLDPARVARRVVTNGFRASFSPDGRQLLYSRRDMQGVEIVDLESGETRTLVAGHRGLIVKDGAFSPDGRHVVFVRHRNVGGEAQYYIEEVWLVPAEGGEPHKLTDGAFPCWSADSERIYFHDRKSNMLRRVALDDPDAGPRDVAACPGWYPKVSPDEKYFAYSVNNELRIAQLSTGRIVQRWTMPTPERGLLAEWSPDSREVSVGGYAASRAGLWIYDIESDEARKVFDGHVSVGVWSPDRTQLAFDVRGPKCELWVATLDPKRPTAESLAMQTDSSGAELTELLHFEGHTHWIYGLAFMPDAAHAVSVAGDRSVRIWDVSTGRAVRRLEMERAATAVAVSSDGKLLAVAVGRNRPERDAGIGFIVLIDFETGEEIRRLTDRHTNEITAVAFSPDDRQLATASFDGTSRLWDVDTGAEIYRFEDRDQIIRDAQFAADGRRLVTFGLHRVARVWDVETGGLLHELGDDQPSELRAIEVTPDGRTVMLVNGRGLIQRYEVETGRLLSEFHTPAELFPDDAVITRDGRHILLGANDGSLHVLELATGKSVCETSADAATFNELAISSDGRFVLTGGGKRWDKDARTSQPAGDFHIRLWRLPETVWP